VDLEELETVVVARRQVIPVTDIEEGMAEYEEDDSESALHAAKLNELISGEFEPDLMSDVMEAVPVPVLLVDSGKTIKFANKAVISLVGVERDILESPLEELFPYPEENHMVSSLVDEALWEKKQVNREGFLRTSGPMKWGRVHVRPTTMDHSEMATVVIENLTAEREVLAACKSKRLLSMFPMGVAEFSLSEPIGYDTPDDKVLSTILNAKLVDGNNEFARIHGHSEIDEALGLAMKDLSSVTKGNQNLYLMWIRKFFPTGSFEFREVPDGSKLRFIEKTLIGELENNRIVSFWELTRDVTERKLSEHKLKKSFDTLKRTLNATVEALIAVAEKRDPYTAGHQRRVARLAKAVAQEMGLSDHRCSGIHVAASIHDIGKIYVPAEFLTKPGAISEAEHVIIRTHPDVGYDILKTIEFPWPIADVILQHHERLDGSGYPAGLHGDDILMEAKIVAVADVLEAMSSHRPYRPSLGLQAALREIRDYRGTRYDPNVVDACLRLMDRGFKLD
jgi:putative nucleotidyltransferase with HDIG domain/PAS domain S-box-containing protein